MIRFIRGYDIIKDTKLNVVYNLYEKRLPLDNLLNILNTLAEEIEELKNDKMDKPESE